MSAQHNTSRHAAIPPPRPRRVPPARDPPHTEAQNRDGAGDGSRHAGRRDVRLGGGASALGAGRSAGAGAPSDPAPCRPGAANVGATRRPTEVTRQYPRVGAGSTRQRDRCRRPPAPADTDAREESRGYPPADPTRRRPADLHRLSGACGETAELAAEAGPIRPARGRPVRRPRPEGRGRAHRGGGAEEAAQVDGPRARPRDGDVRLRRPVPDDHRGLRGAVQPAVRDPDRRPLADPRLRRGPVRRARPGRHHHLRDHPHQEPAGQGRPQVPLLRLPHRRGVARPVHDLQRRVDAVPLPRRAVRGVAAEGRHEQPRDLELPLRQRRRVRLGVGRRAADAPRPHRERVARDDRHLAADRRRARSSC